MTRGRQERSGHTEHQRQGVTLVEVVVVVAIVLVLSGLVLSGVAAARSAGTRTACQNNLRQIGLAMQAYHATAGKLPPGVSYRSGKEVLRFAGWGLRLLPYLEQEALWAESVRAFEQEWRFKRVPPHVGMAFVIRLYSCPGDGRMEVLGGINPKVRFGFTSYVGCQGLDQFRRDGVLFLDSNVSMTDVRDGTSHTVLAAERPPGSDGHLGWWYAGEGQDKNGSAEMLLGAREQCTYYPKEKCERAGHRFQPGRVEYVCDALHYWSMHPGGANFLFCDGSVRFLAYDADGILEALVTRAGREVLPD